MTTQLIVAVVTRKSLIHVIQKIQVWFFLLHDEKGLSRISTEALRIQVMKMKISPRCRQSHPSGGTRAETVMLVTAPMITTRIGSTF